MSRMICRLRLEPCSRPSLRQEPIDFALSQKALAEARRLAEEVGGVYAQWLAAVVGDKTLNQLTAGERTVRDHYRELALAAIKEGAAKGYSKTVYLESEPDMEPLHALPELRQWLVEFKKGLMLKQWAPNFPSRRRLALVAAKVSRLICSPRRTTKMPRMPQCHRSPARKCVSGKPNPMPGNDLWRKSTSEKQAENWASVRLDVPRR